MRYDLTWGESVCVRQAFVDNVHGNPTVFNTQHLMDFGYPKHEGDEHLISMTVDVIRRQTGFAYKHVFLTNGATGAIVIAMRAYGMVGYNAAWTNKAPWFSLYPIMIEAAGLAHTHDDDGKGMWDRTEYVKLIDSPSNPLGMIGIVRDVHDPSPTIWDAVYHNNVYTDGKRGTIPHDIVCGSYSKLTGLNGIRIGWIGTNDDRLADILNRLITAEYCGLSHASTEVLLNTLPSLDWDQFEIQARFRLDLNRTEWQKLSRYFGGTPVSNNGMFYYAEIDDAAKKLMAKAGVLFQSGAKMGTTEGFARFNLGQDNYLVTDAVKAVLKADRI
jgi:aspartate/methionine/tyrosine aminotransferase